jgi:hypothetical protein
MPFGNCLKREESMANAFSIYAAIIQKERLGNDLHTIIARCKRPKMPQWLIFDDFDTNCLN